MMHAASATRGHYFSESKRSVSLGDETPVVQKRAVDLRFLPFFWMELGVRPGSQQLLRDLVTLAPESPVRVAVDAPTFVHSVGWTLVRPTVYTISHPAGECVGRGRSWGDNSGWRRIPQH